MAVKAEKYPEAERLYVQERCTFEQISSKLGVSERTLRYWAKEGSWQERRQSLEESAGKMHEKLAELMEAMTDKLIEGMKTGEEPSQSQLYFITKMAPTLLKIRTYEETAAPPDKSGNKTEAVSKYETLMDEMQKTLMQLGLG